MFTFIINHYVHVKATSVSASVTAKALLERCLLSILTLAVAEHTSIILLLFAHPMNTFALLGIYFCSLLYRNDGRSPHYRLIKILYIVHAVDVVCAHVHIYV